jgi:hypothetical protein
LDTGSNPVSSTNEKQKATCQSGFLFSPFFSKIAQMTSDEIREKLQNIIRGASLERQGDCCATVRNLLIQSFGTNTTAKREFESRAVVKEKQGEFLKIPTTYSSIFYKCSNNINQLSHP